MSESITPSLEDLLILTEASETNDLVSPEEVPSLLEDVSTEEPKEQEDIEEVPALEEEVPATVTESEEPEEEEEEDDLTALTKANFKFLVENNVFTAPEGFEFDGTPEKLEEAIEITRNQLAEQAFNALWSKLPQDYQAALRHGLAGGNNIRDFVSRYSPSLDYNNIDLNSVDTQKEVLREYYKKTTKYDDDKINRFIARLEVSDDLLPEAEDAVEYLKENLKEEQERLLQEQEQQRIAQEQAMEEARQNVIKTIQELPEINSRRKNSLQAFIYNPITRGDRTDTDLNRAIANIQANPSHFVQLADILMDYNPEKGFDLSRFEKRGESSAATKFQKKLEESLSDVTSAVRRGKTTAPAKNDVNWEEILKHLD